MRVLPVLPPLGLLGLLGLLGAGCLRETEFRCESDAVCNLQFDGKCERDGYCSFPDSKCSSRRRYGEEAGPLANECVVCPGFAALGTGTVGHFYLRAPQTLRWELQRDFCRSSVFGGYLAVPNDFAELSTLARLAEPMPPSVFWVGIHDRDVEGSYTLAAGGAATFLPWASGQPDNGGTGQDCVSADTGKLSDDDCAITLPAVCECETPDAL